MTVAIPLWLLWVLLGLSVVGVFASLMFLVSLKRATLVRWVKYLNKEKRNAKGNSI